MEVIKLSSPPACGVRVLVVGVGCFVGPHLADKDLPIELQEDILVHSVVECFVVTVGSVGYSCIDDRNELHVHGVESVDDGRKPIEGAGVTSLVLLRVGEISVVLHVVDINPLSVEGDLVVNVALERFLELSIIVIAPAALVPSESPLGDKIWGSNETLILGNDRLWSLGRKNNKDVTETTSGNSR